MHVDNIDSNAESFLLFIQLFFDRSGQDRQEYHVIRVHCLYHPSKYVSLKKIVIDRF